MGAGPLQGIRVIDLTVWMSGAIGAMLLGDLGADVIKVEGPTGDPVRRYVPIGATGATDAADDGLRTVAMPFTLSGYAAPARAARRPGEDDDEVLGRR